MKTSDLFVAALENEGVEYIFGIPGEENLDFLESLRTSSIRLILTRHEQAAGFMAATYGRLTGRPGVCLSTLGPGATNFTTPAAYALLGGMPALFITGQKPIKKSKQGHFQIVDIVRMMEPITKFSARITDGNTLPHLVRHCFRVAQAEKPGSVHLELPEDIAGEAVDRTPFPVTTVNPSAADQASIAKAAELIANATYPLVVIASAANRGHCVGPIRDFVERSGLYFLTTQMGKGVVDEGHERCLGTAALSEHDYVHRALDRADLIVNIGHDVTEKPAFFMHSEGPAVIHIAALPAQVDDVYFPQHEVIGCVHGTMRAMLDLVRPSANWDMAFFDRVRDQIVQHVYAASSSDDQFPSIPQRVVADVREAMPGDGILSLDNGMYKIWFARNYVAHEPNTLLLDNALASMGAGLPAAMAARIVYPDRKVAAVCGDGGFLMNSQELETAVRLKLDLVVIVLRDDAYGMIKWKQGGYGFGDFGLDFGNPDFVRYAEAYGARGVRLSRTGELSRVLSERLEAPGVHLIEVPIDYSASERVLLEELRQLTCEL
ncbi:MAG: acetolactate synthase large subunit [Pirellulales bacterium]